MQQSQAALLEPPSTVVLHGARQGQIMQGNAINYVVRRL